MRHPHVEASALEGDDVEGHVKAAALARDTVQEWIREARSVQFGAPDLGLLQVLLQLILRSLQLPLHVCHHSRRRCLAINLCLHTTEIRPVSLQFHSLTALLLLLELQAPPGSTKILFTRISNFNRDSTENSSH